MNQIDTLLPSDQPAEANRRSTIKQLVIFAAVVLAIAAVTFAVAFMMRSVHSQILGIGHYILSSSTDHGFLINIDQLERVHGPFRKMVNGETEVVVGWRKLRRIDTSTCQDMITDNAHGHQVLAFETACAHMYSSRDGFTIVIVPASTEKLGVTWQYRGQK